MTARKADGRKTEKAVFVKVQIPQYTVENDSKKQFVLYHIDCTYKVHKWTVKKRYNDCKQLNDRLTAEAKLENRSGIRLPTFPGKILFGNLNPVKIEQRRNELNEWLGAWTYYISTNDMKNLEHLVNIFLELDQNNSDTNESSDNN
jgi:hypothetical protein